MLFSDLVPYKVKNIYKANHGYWEYKSVFLPAFFGSAAGIAALAVGITLIVKAVKKKKSK